MSTATAFKYHRPFPFCKSQATVSSILTDPANGYDYFDFDGTDEGLANAMQFFWNLENLTFTPSGSDSGSSFFASFSFPSPSLTNLTSYSATGYIVEESLVSGSIVTTRPAQPISRVCFPATAFTVTVVSIIRAIYIITGSENTCQLNLAIAFDTTSSRWRLYYSFVFRHNIASIIANPAAVTGGVLVNSGSITLFGKSLPWEARKLSIFGIFTGSGLTSSDSYFTY